MSVTRGYGQFCPVAKASEVIAQRWTPLILRELVAGSHHFNQLRRAIPLISPTMLSQRLAQLEDMGVLSRRRLSSGGRDGWDYRLTQAGRELAPMIQLLGIWGQRWAQRQIRGEDLDPGFLMWAAHRHLPVREFPSRKGVVLFEFPEQVAVGRRRWWLRVADGDVELCLKDPGYDLDLRVVSSVRTMAEVYLGRRSPGAAVRAGLISLSGSPVLERSFPRWCPRSGFADVKAPRGTG